MHPPQDLPAVVAPPAPQQEVNLLIADVAALTGIPAPQLRSWEQAGLLRPRRSPNAMRLYGVEDVARARLIKRSLVNPGRRGSLRRLAARLASGELRPAPEDYAGLVNPAAGPVPLPDSLFWQAVVDAMDELVVVCDTRGLLTYANPALRAVLPPSTPPHQSARPSRSATGEPLPLALEALPLRWAARTGTQHRDLALSLPRQGGGERHTRWTVTPLRGADGLLHGAVGVGRMAPDALAHHREDWLAIAAHDLRGPVTSILGRLELARRAMAHLQADGGAPAVPQETLGHLNQHVATAELSTLDLIRMMETYLDASAAAAGVLTQHLEPGGVDLALLARRAVEHAQSQTSRHLLTLEGTHAPLWVAGDRMRLRQVLANLLANAVKYSPDGGAISVQVAALATLPDSMASVPAVREETGTAPRWALLRVTDPGLGIPAVAQPRVFDRYWRAEGPTSALPGNGLGLYTCRAIVAAHGGHIWVERSVQAPAMGRDDSEWHGTVIAVLLPLAPPAGVAAGAIAATPDEREETDGDA